MKWMLMTGLAVAGLVSCAPSTPEARIARAPERFEALPDSQRELVRRGELERGMSMDAVWLSWGAPNRRFEGSQEGRRSERWDYAGSVPVYTHHFSTGYGRGYYGPYRYAAIGPEVTYVPYRRASVWFVDGVVDAWERDR